MKIHALDHVVFNVSDIDRSLQFYGGTLGLPVERLDDYRRGEVKFPSVRISAESIIDLFPPSMHGERGRGDANVNHVCLVAGGTIEQIESELRDAGVAIENGPVEVFGARGNGTSVYVRDPDGNRIEVRSYETIKGKSL
jgi:catechol 2,3-dioxygenase-like lactoylglutathione lyase family enzyme